MPVYGFELSGVSCSAATACTAVGDSPTEDEAETFVWVGRWNGRKWATQQAPSPPTTAGSVQETLLGVSCTSADSCTAVGYYDNTETSFLPLIEVWNGKTWKIPPSPTSFAPSSFTGLYQVSCTSAHACTAVGTTGTSGSYQPLVESWNGTAWTVQPIPDPHGGSLDGVSCTSATACTAVGSYWNTAGTIVGLAYRWNGTTWASQTIAQPPTGWTPELSAVSCTSPRACTAAGDRHQPHNTHPHTLIEHWNGTTWAIQHT